MPETIRPAGRVHFRANKFILLAVNVKAGLLRGNLSANYNPTAVEAETIGDIN